MGSEGLQQPQAAKGIQFFKIVLINGTFICPKSVWPLWLQQAFNLFLGFNGVNAPLPLSNDVPDQCPDYQVTLT